jgi:hypothetical protein
MDADGDNLSNFVEYQAGTNPTNKASALRLEAPLWDTTRGGIVLRWLSAPGKLYTIEGSADLIGGAWATLSSNVPGTGFIQELPVADPTPRTRFYRIRLQP